MTRRRWVAFVHHCRDLPRLAGVPLRRTLYRAGAGPMVQEFRPAVGGWVAAEDSA